MVLAVGGVSRIISGSASSCSILGFSLFFSVVYDRSTIQGGVASASFGVDEDGAMVGSFVAITCTSLNISSILVRISLTSSRLTGLSMLESVSLAMSDA